MIVHATHPGFQWSEDSPDNLRVTDAVSSRLSLLPSLTYAPDPSPSQDQSFWKSIHSDGRKQCPLHPTPVPPTLPHPPSHQSLWKSSKLLLLYSCYYPTGRGAMSGCQMVWWQVWWAGYRLKQGWGDHMLGSLPDRVKWICSQHITEPVPVSPHIAGTSL